MIADGTRLSGMSLPRVPSAQRFSAAGLGTRFWFAPGQESTSSGFVAWSERADESGSAFLRADPPLRSTQPDHQVDRQLLRRRLDGEPVGPARTPQPRGVALCRPDVGRVDLLFGYGDLGTLLEHRRGCPFGVGDGPWLPRAGADHVAHCGPLNDSAHTNDVRRRLDRAQLP